jgi:hypothetical protein
MLEPLRSVDLESKITLLRDLIRRPDSADWQLPAGSLRRRLGRSHLQIEILKNVLGE